MIRIVATLAAALAATLSGQAGAQGGAAEGSSAEQHVAERGEADRRAPDRGAAAQGATEQGATEHGAAERGALVYQTTCAHCHDRLPEGAAIDMLPGSESLSLKYRGTLSPYITERPDLANHDVLRAFLRNGTGSMPPFRKTEVTDEDIAAIAAYFTQSSSD